MPTKKKIHCALPDTQNHAAPVQLPLQKVGIHEFKHPAMVPEAECNGAVGRADMQPADFSMYVDLDKKNKGISMSRLPRLLAELTWERHPELPKSITAVFDSGHEDGAAQWYSGSIMNVCRGWAKEILDMIPDSHDSYIKTRFLLPKWKRSPVSLLKAIEYYETVLEVRNTSKGLRFYVTAKVRYISTCPCSTHLSAHAIKTKMTKQAFPHMQPSYATIKLELDEKTFLQHNFIASVIVKAEAALVTIPYPMVKREDEQAIAIACGNHQMFCEDAARLLAKNIDGPGIKDWVIVCDHDESIHSHFATAVVWKGVKGGLR